MQQQQSPFHPPSQMFEPPTPPSKPILGPIGFLALGATVALICFLAVHTLMK
jgi:hypothetical protein